MAITYLEAISEHQSRVAVAALKVAKSTEQASLQATRSFTQAFFALSSPLVLATSFTFELVEQQLALAKQLNDIFGKQSEGKQSNKVTRANPQLDSGSARKTIDSASVPKTIDSADARTTISDARSTIDDAARRNITPANDAAQALAKTAQTLAKTADDAVKASVFQGRVEARENVAPPVVRTTEKDQEIELRAERLVINKQRVQHGEARVRKEIVTEMKSIAVPVSREELVIERYAVAGDADIDSKPIADETIRIPLNEDRVNFTKKTFVREEVEIGKRRVEDVAHISDDLRHEELRVLDDATTNQTGRRVIAEKNPMMGDDAAPAIITPAQALKLSADGVAPAIITPAQALNMTTDGVTPTIITPAQALNPKVDDVAPALVTPAQALAPAIGGVGPALVTPSDEDQEIELRAERLVVNKQRVQNGKARVRKEIVTETKSVAVPVEHEEVVINRRAVAGDVDADVDSAPIGDETIRVPLTEDRVNIGKETVVREEVEMGKRRVEDMEHVSDTVRHEELRVNDPTKNDYSESVH